MKKLVLLCIISLFYFTGYTQVSDAKEVSVEMSEGKQQGWKFLIPSADRKLALKSWEKLMKEYDSKTEKVKKGEEYVSSNAIIPALSEREIVVYAQFDETPEGVYMTVFFDLGGAYLNQHMHPDKVKPAQKLLNDFAKEVAIEAMDELIKAEEKLLKKIEGERSSLKSDQDNYEREIKECEDKISQRKKDLENNAEEQKKKESELKEQQEKVDQIKAKRKKF